MLSNVVTHLSLPVDVTHLSLPLSLPPLSLSLSLSPSPSLSLSLPWLGLVLGLGPAVGLHPCLCIHLYEEFTRLARLVQFTLTYINVA